MDYFSFFWETWKSFKPYKFLSMLFFELCFVMHGTYDFNFITFYLYFMQNTVPSASFMFDFTSLFHFVFVIVFIPHISIWICTMKTIERFTLKQWEENIYLIMYKKIVMLLLLQCVMTICDIMQNLCKCIYLSQPCRNNGLRFHKIIFSSSQFS